MQERPSVLLNVPDISAEFATLPDRLPSGTSSREPQWDIPSCREWFNHSRKPKRLKKSLAFRGFLKYKIAWFTVNVTLHSCSGGIVRIPVLHIHSPLLACTPLTNVLLSQPLPQLCKTSLLNKKFQRTIVAPIATIIKNSHSLLPHSLLLHLTLLKSTVFQTDTIITVLQAVSVCTRRPEVP
jgi:hypothetical protein